MMDKLYIGTAGWSIPAAHASNFPFGGTHLERYAAMLRGVEINSSFYKLHRRSTYERWARSVPTGFKFTVKMPKIISHERGLKDCETILADLISGTQGLGERHGVWLL